MDDSRTERTIDISGLHERPPELVRDRYRILRHLGSGGSGTVFAALDTHTGEQVALKRITLVDTDDARRVAREVAALRLMRIPGVVRLRDHGPSEAGHDLIMDLIEGAPFPGTPSQDWADVGPVATALLETVARIHDAGLVHRDLKPENVLVASGAPVVLDFGVARGKPLGSTVTRPGTVVGTPRYLAPEQLRGQPATPASDRYAIGVMLYEALAGVAPHGARDLDELIRERLYKSPEPLSSLRPDLPREVSRAVDALLSPDPAARPATRHAVRALSGDEQGDDWDQQVVGHAFIYPNVDPQGLVAPAMPPPPNYS